jgi:hypothetical protein
MRPGPKGQINVEPLDFTGWPAERAARRERFITEFLIVPRGHGAGQPFRLRDFQSEIICGAFAPGVRTGLVSMPRANGKTMLAAALAVAELWVGPPSAEALVVASDQRQANITLRYARRMIELNPILAERCHIFADRPLAFDSGPSAAPQCSRGRFGEQARPHGLERAVSRTWL